MPDDNTGGDPQTTPAGEMPKGSDADNKPTVDELVVQLADTRKALKAVNNESAARRKKLQAFEDAKKEREDAEMTELEKSQASLVEMTTANEQLQQTIRDAKVDAAINAKAVELKFRNPADARALIDMNAVTLSDDGKVSGVDKALQALVKERPYLTELVTKMPNTDSRKRNTSKATVQSDEYDAQIKARYDIG